MFVGGGGVSASDRIQKLKCVGVRAATRVSSTIRADEQRSQWGVGHNLFAGGLGAEEKKKSKPGTRDVIGVEKNQGRITSPKNGVTVIWTE